MGLGLGLGLGCTPPEREQLRGGHLAHLIRVRVGLGLLRVRGRVRVGGRGQW